MPSLQAFYLVSAWRDHPEEARHRKKPIVGEITGIFVIVNKEKKPILPWGREGVTSRRDYGESENFSISVPAGPLGNFRGNYCGILSLFLLHWRP
jgi:hypothetical protein